jgi:hypothetical protein
MLSNLFMNPGMLSQIPGLAGLLGRTQQQGPASAAIPQTRLPQAMGPFSSLAYQMGGAPQSMRQWPPPGFGGLFGGQGGRVSAPQNPATGWAGRGLLGGGMS